MMRERKTKPESGKSNEVLTRKTRKVAAMKIADVEDVSPVEVEEINDLPLKKRPYKRSAKRTMPGRKKTDKFDGLRELSIRYDKRLKAVFAELNNDRRHQDFTVECAVGMPAEGYVGTSWIVARLWKKGHCIHMIETHILRYPEDVEDIATALYVEMNYRGLDVAEALGV